MTVAEKQQLQAKILEAMDKHRIAAFATVEGNKPKVRYMALFHDGMNVYLATDRKTHKVEELQQNPNVSLLLGYEAGSAPQVVELEGTASITKDDSLRQKLWNKELSKWFEGPDDPNYVILDIQPSVINYYDEQGKPQRWTP
ncbi:pyridoxamine 5'-phosphate oxidase family protein [Paenibacillus methanolicus]|uniref:General stress protein 26 n=1 Tax=Paenibacillus methanolicus TaxID=582686 RepID=A0A5S5CIN6_9BACL|nr:pyridoxamine 5'-phosphate oxidase family protein [Paenibacillus methanolicus]TYP79656.1 general stress protein 26 [Paenibacillus methanolicus]